MSLDNLLAPLKNVRRTRPGHWIASCPAHDDRRPSLAIRQLDNGMVLLHDFGGCATTDVLAVLGLTLEDLFPERNIGHSSSVLRPFYTIDVLRCIAFEALVVCAAASRLTKGSLLSDVDRERLLLAASRLQAAMEVCNG